jgi:hypothetical protein
MVGLRRDKLALLISAVLVAPVRADLRIRVQETAAVARRNVGNAGLTAPIATMITVSRITWTGPGKQTLGDRGSRLLGPTYETE